MTDKRYRRQISLIDIQLPSDETAESELEWIFQCLGLGGDEDKLAKEIFKQIVKATRDSQGISSRELKDSEKVTQAAIVYHLNVFMRSGLVIKQGRIYMLRAPTLEETLDELENDLVSRLERIKRIAKKLEKEITEE